ncbi:MAG: HD domain-containing protein [Gemmatimonadota bacterium]|nr:HD domain-containing protein [Gemmatimonadota bacterium]MDH5761085.1 HD domain-containing protein [Gemmatimonadota bacterium]
MSPEAKFLIALAQAFSAMSLYKAGHPAREKALARALEAVWDLQDVREQAVYTFLGAEVVFGNRPVRELKVWDLGPRLSGAGIQRLELLSRVTPGDMDTFLDEAFRRLQGEVVSSSEAKQTRESSIRFGEVGLKGEDEGSGTGAERLATATLGYSLREEYSGVEWLHGELKDRRQLHLLEAEGIVRSLTVAMHGDQSFLVPLLRLKEYDQYTTTHALNVSVLTMALAEFLGLSPREVRAFGMAGLLHDLGKVKIPDEILNKPGALSESERQVMNSHTVEGARIIMETEHHLDLAAVVAYEHHLRIDGGGYPKMKHERATHQASALVHVCDVFDALRTNRPYRDALPTARAIQIIREGAGTDFDPEVARAFLTMMERWESRISEVPVEADGMELHPATLRGQDPSTVPIVEAPQDDGLAVVEQLLATSTPADTADEASSVDVTMEEEPDRSEGGLEWDLDADLADDSEDEDGMVWE